MKWTRELPSKEGTYQMKDGNDVYTIFVEKWGDGLSFRIKGNIGQYDLNTANNCLFRKMK